ncbi:YqaJ viral recombinase family protein [Ectopseudomonas alcaliphila]|uniref:Putative phage-type endonuclease n=2 Tax=Ectopseudomonas alcaliphila TaxID=101564 RepID=A0A1G7JD77_9GAMM|nr:YqaJ viral recombinase family protein [Pseudomonas alcaliphila]MDX5995414.1 YqaJ viral recombinase family protein [Pseudomonas alcaliphila]MDX5995459.1 YqaJ viral recombinase family protein [Pseudomonas alcaliphila]SDF22881.1 putative phage-type endonuclease [Pseudomonas alcaliphila]
MKIHNVQQGTPEWHALRASHFTASEAPAMMGASKYQSRSDLLAMKKTGIVPEVTAAQQNLFDLGHATEEMARPLVEELIGEELFPIVGTSGNLLASLDGATMLGDTLFEHKLWNEKVAYQVRTEELEPHYYWQLEQQLLVSGAERVIFVCSDGTRANFEHMEYRPVPGRAEQLIAGWKQFEEELADFVPQETKVEAVGLAPEQLPALRVEVTGMVKASNLDEFKRHALAVLGNINTTLESDQDFADADKTVKWCGDVEERLELVKQQILGQTTDIDQVFRTIDEISAQTRAKRLELNKMVESRKKSIREEIVIAAAKALQDHIDQINATLGGKIRMPKVPADFANAIKGKKTVASLKEAADTELARAKIEASRVGDGIRANIASLNELARAHGFLFHDAQDLVLKANDDLVALIKTRISEHEEAEAEKRRVAEQQAQAAAQPLQAQAVEQASDLVEVAKEIDREQTVAITPAAVQQADNGQRIKLGDITSRLGFTLTADFLSSLGFEPVGQERAAKLYRTSDFPRICAALINHIQGVQLSKVA